jgi:RNA polymerase sigma-70 factor (ECF subfamily)
MSALAEPTTTGAAAETAETAAAPARGNYPAISEATIAAAQDGDRAAFDVIYTAYESPIYNYVYRTMGDADDARDLTQDAFLKAWLAFPRTLEYASFSLGPWLYRIASNVCLDVLRHRRLVKWQSWEAFLAAVPYGAWSRWQQALVDDAPQPDRMAERQELVAEVRAVLDGLLPQYRLHLHLREYGDLSYDEIAEVLSTTRAAVKSTLHRARRSFADAWSAKERQGAADAL